MKSNLAGLCKLLLVAAFLVAGGCQFNAKEILPERLLPQKQPVPFPAAQRQINRALTVMPVTGDRPRAFNGVPYITNQEFEAELVRALRESQMFTRVNDAPDADLNLFTQISKVTTYGKFSPTYALWVDYRLVDANSGKEVWRQTVSSRRKAEWNEGITGEQRIELAVQGAVRQNLERLLDMLIVSDL